jgi:hypothetical protein
MVGVNTNRMDKNLMYNNLMYNNLMGKLDKTRIHVLELKNELEETKEKLSLLTKIEFNNELIQKLQDRQIQELIKYIHCPHTITNEFHHVKVNMQSSFFNEIETIEICLDCQKVLTCKHTHEKTYLPEDEDGSQVTICVDCNKILRMCY